MEERNANRPETERLRFRIGINLGDVIHDEGDIFATVSMSRRVFRL
jgi:hypothetical protein